MIQLEVHILSRQTKSPMEVEGNNDALREELDLIEEIRSGPHLERPCLNKI